MKSKSSIFIAIVAVLLIGGGLIYFFVLKKEDPAISTSTPKVGSSGLVSTTTGKTTGTVVANTAVTGDGDQVVNLLRSLSVIQLSDAVFQNPLFTALADLSITLPPVTNQGRRNPFAPIGASNTSLETADLVSQETDIPVEENIESDTTTSNAF